MFCFHIRKMVFPLQADWSDQYVFNVHARSVAPCDPHTGGIGKFVFNNSSVFFLLCYEMKIFSRVV